MINNQIELSDIAEKWTEPEYRQRPELSYSTLSTYESLGFDGLDHLFDKKESPSLTFGSVVDTLLTGGIEEFNNTFVVMNININDTGIAICKSLVAQYKDEEGKPLYSSFKDIPLILASQAAKEAGFWKADKWSDETRYKHIYDNGDIEEYYNSLIHNTKRIIDQKTYEEACQCVTTLKTAPVTAPLFENDIPFSNIRHYYQLKFKAVLNDVGYRSMMDLIIVDYDKKIIYPYDLKTCGIPEWNFQDNFKRFHYAIQARLYYRVLKYNVKHSSAFKDFKIEPFRFIVINRYTLTPLVWEFNLTDYVGDIVDDKGNVSRDPFTIGTELHYYLEEKPHVPKNIDTLHPNLIACYRPKPIS